MNSMIYKIATDIHDRALKWEDVQQRVYARIHAEEGLQDV